jgi:hypothetical protein
MLLQKFVCLGVYQFDRRTQIKEKWQFDSKSVEDWSVLFLRSINPVESAA